MNFAYMSFFNTLMLGLVTIIQYNGLNTIPRQTHGNTAFSTNNRAYFPRSEQIDTIPFFCPHVATQEGHVQSLSLFSSDRRPISGIDLIFNKSRF